MDVDVEFENQLGIGLSAIHIPEIRIQDLPEIKLAKIGIGIDKLGIGLDKLAVGLDAIEIRPIHIPEIRIKELPKINVGIDPLKVDLGPITLNPIDFNLAITEIPSVRVHVPMHLSFAFSFLGHSLFGARLGGEAQVITEPYSAKPCEACAGATKGSHA